MKKITFTIGIILFVIAGVTTIKFFSNTQRTDTKVSGRYFGNQVWSREIIVTGDVEIMGNLTVLPGTVVKFAVGDDTGRGDQIEKDGFNDNDPTRLKSYTITHSGLFILRKFIAEGTLEQNIIFTSDAQNPHLADWESIVFMGDKSIVDNVVVEYSRNGLNPIGAQPNSVIKNSKILHTLWGSISTSHSGIQIINNYLADAGHEGIDLAYKAPQIVRGNLIEDCHTGMYVYGESAAIIENNIVKNCGDGINVEKSTTAKVSGNTYIPAPEDSKLEWRYDDYVIPLFGNPD